MDYTNKRNTMIRYMDVARAEDDQTQYLMMEENAMRYKPLPIGIDNFKQLIEQGYYYVDKTAFIKDLIDMKGAVNLFTRPRRFGKTLNMSMLQYFFEDMHTVKGEPIDNRGIFDGLGIMQAGEQYLSHMGVYPVITLTLKAGKQSTFESAYRQLIRQISMEFERHYYLLDTDMPDETRERYKSILGGHADRDVFKNSIQFLSKCLERYYGKKVILLIDEYDVPLENAFLCGFYDEMIDFIRALFESALKTNSSLDFAVITGCLRISKESIFTGMNNLTVISILNEQYDEYFGFKDDEVRKMCDDYGLSHKFEIFKSWYDGYSFGNADVYNPWSVIQFMFDLRANENCYAKAYWANTSSNSIVRELIGLADESVKAELELLIDGGTIEKPIHEDITYAEVYETMDNLWNFMFFTGYFRKVSERISENDIRYLTLRIPNREVRYIFYTKVSAWFQAKMKQRDMSRLHNAFIRKDVTVFEEELNDIMMETISSMDEHENYYHGLVAGLLTGIKGYITKSNREPGKGRCDLFVRPVSRRKEAFIVEFKVTKKLGELEAKTDEALAQIKDRNYEKELIDDNYSVISRYGIAFCGKECMVKLEEH